MLAGVGSRERAVDVGAARGRALTNLLLLELRNARLDRGLESKAVARAVGLSPAQYSRIERGQSTSISIVAAAKMLSTVGLELSVRTYPQGEPLRDAAHVALLERLRGTLHRSLKFTTEVPFPSPGDRRAWDAVIRGSEWRYGIEAETRPRDRQALERRLALKLRDGDVDGLGLLLLNSRHNREFARVHRDVLKDRLPIPSGRAIELLGAGVYPGGSSVILL
jgi:transcriptional regulator with XRE-family HTH domain